jgi:hypothetical protein
LPEFCPQFWNGRKSLERGDHSWNQQILREISPGFSGSMGTACPCWSHGFFEAFDSLQNPSTIFCRCSAAGKATTAGVSGWNPPVHHLVPYEMAMKWQSYHVLESQNSLFGIYLGLLFCFKDVSKSFYILQDCEFLSPFFGSIWGCRVELLFLMKTVATSHGPKIWIIHSIIPWCFAIHHVFFWCVPTWLKTFKIFLRWLKKSLLPAVTSMIIPASVHLTAQAPFFRHHEDWRDRSL